MINDHQLLLSDCVSDLCFLLLTLLSHIDGHAFCHSHEHGEKCKM